MGKKNKNGEEEIDLGSFFNQIGKLFSRFFKWVLNLFKGLYHMMIMSLIFVKNNFIKLAIAAVVGIVLGYFVEKNTSKTYSYNMIIEPNYDGAFQMDERIKYYNQLISNKDLATLSKLFAIEKEDAASILKFELKVKLEYKDLVEEYDKFIMDKDSITIANTPLEKFSEKHFTFFGAKRYLLRMKLNRNALNKNIEKELVADFENNTHLQNQKEHMMNRLNKQEANILKLINDIDSTRASNKLIAITAAQNGQINTTNLEWNKEANTEDKDLGMFRIFKSSYEDLDFVLMQKEKFGSIYKIITPFQPQGKVHTGIFYNKIVFISLISILLMTLFLILKPILNYLDKYKK